MDLTSLLQTDRPLVVGVLNVTPDSFSDGGRYPDVDAAVAQARRMIDQGADIIDVGGESTRPGAPRIGSDEQRQRVLPVVERVAHNHGLVSIDTTRADVAAAALDAGAAIVNDVSAGRDDEAMFPLVAERGVPIVLMHMQGDPQTMQQAPAYDDVVGEVRAFLADRAFAAEAHGVARHDIVIDPGIGFGKTVEHNLALLAGLDRFVATGYPVLLGASRKSFMGKLLNLPDPADRVEATVATTAIAVMAGVRLLRVHDVKPNRHAADVTAAMLRHRSGWKRVVEQ